MPHKKTFLIIAIVLGLFILAYIIAYSILGAMTVNKKTSDQEIALTKVENALGLTLTTLERDGKEAIELHVIKDGLAEKYGVKDGDLLATRSLAHFVQAAQTSLRIIIDYWLGLCFQRTVDPDGPSPDLERLPGPRRFIDAWHHPNRLRHH